MKPQLKKTLKQIFLISLFIPLVVVFVLFCRGQLSSVDKRVFYFPASDSWVQGITSVPREFFGGDEYHDLEIKLDDDYPAKIEIACELTELRRPNGGDYLKDFDLVWRNMTEGSSERTSKYMGDFTIDEQNPVITLRTRLKTQRNVTAVDLRGKIKLFVYGQEYGGLEILVMKKPDYTTIFAIGGVASFLIFLCWLLGGTKKITKNSFPYLLDAKRPLTIGKGEGVDIKTFCQKTAPKHITLKREKKEELSRETITDEDGYEETRTVKKEIDRLILSCNGEVELNDETVRSGKIIEPGANYTLKLKDFRGKGSCDFRLTYKNKKWHIHLEEDNLKYGSHLSRFVGF